MPRTISLPSGARTRQAQTSGNQAPAAAAGCACLLPGWPWIAATPFRATSNAILLLHRRAKRLLDAPEEILVKGRVVEGGLGRHALGARLVGLDDLGEGEDQLGPRI